MLHKLLLLLLLSSLSDAAPYPLPPTDGSVVRMVRGADLPAALANSSVGLIEVLCDMKLHEEDWTGMAQLPVVVSRKVTLRAAPYLPYRPALDLNYLANKVKLVPGAELAFEGLVLLNVRNGLFRAAPGIDLLADSPVPQPGEKRPTLRLEQAAFVQRLCQPLSSQLTANQAVLRPDELPGTQLSGMATNPANCSSSATARMDRCYPLRMLQVDIALPGVRLNAVGWPSMTNYVILGLDVQGLCEAMMDTACLANRTVLQCYVEGMARLPPPDDSGSAGDGCSSGDASATGGDAAGGGGGGVSAGVVAAAVVGGTAAALLLAGVGVWYRRRQRKQQHQPLHQNSTMKTAEEVQSSSAGTTMGTSTGQAPESVNARALPSSPGSGSAVMTMVTERTPFCPHVRLDLRWSEDVVVDEHAMRGAGAFGRVLEGNYQGQRVAVKVLHLPPQHRAAPQQAISGLQQEVHVLGRCSHPNVVRVLGACLEPPHLCLVMELMDQSLQHMLDAHGRGGGGSSALPLEQVLGLAIDIAGGLAYLHPTIVHRDLKPANVLLDAAGTAKLSDFGLARLRETVCETVHPEAGTAAYMAPECFNPQNFVITHKADIYSFGILLWQLLTGDTPWSGTQPIGIALAVSLQQQRPPLWKLGEANCPPKLRKLVAECWDEDPLRRPSAEEVVKRLVMVRQQAAGEASAEAPSITTTIVGHTLRAEGSFARRDNGSGAAPTAADAPAHGHVGCNDRALFPEQLVLEISDVLPNLAPQDRGCGVMPCITLECDPHAAA